MFYISKDTELTSAHILKFIDGFKMQHLPRLSKLDRYYKNKNDIKNRVFTDLTKPNNKMSHSWGNYITDTTTAFFLGQPVSYSGEDEDIKLLDYIFEQNDEQDLNLQIATDQSIFGVAYELGYLDELAEIRFAKLSPLTTIPIFDDTINSNLLYCIRFMEIEDILTNTKTMHVWLYDDKSSKYYKQTDNATLLFVSEEKHNFDIVPVSIYLNNDNMIGDFENQIDLIDMYDRLESDTANAFDYYNDCYLVFTGATVPDDITEMKENRILEVPEGGDVKFLIKNGDNIEQENVKNRVVADIHKFSKTPNMADDNFANNVSGVAMKYKLLGLEHICSIKERKFKRGLQNRLWLISNVKEMKKGTDLQDVKITFKRNLPNNETEIAEMANNLRGLVSTETLISQLPFIENVKDELEKLEAEKEINSYELPFTDIEEDGENIGVN